MSRTEPIIVGPGQTRHADGRSLVVPDELQCKVRTSDLGGRLCITLADHAPWEGPPLHTHRDGDEWFYVIKGEFVYEVGGKLHRVVEGGSLVAPQKIPHRYINGPLPSLTAQAVLSPDSKMLAIFTQTAESGIKDLLQPHRARQPGLRRAKPRSRSRAEAGIPFSGTARQRRIPFFA